MSITDGGRLEGKLLDAHRDAMVYLTRDLEDDDIALIVVQCCNDDSPIPSGILRFAGACSRAGTRVVLRDDLDEASNPDAIRKLIRQAALLIGANDVESF